MAESAPTLDSVVRATEGLISSEVDGQLVMMDIERGTYFGLDSTAARIWAGLAVPTRLSDLCQSLVEEYDVDPATCEAEVLGFVRELHSNGLVILQ